MNPPMTPKAMTGCSPPVSSTRVTKPGMIVW